MQTITQIAFHPVILSSLDLLANLVVITYINFTKFSPWMAIVTFVVIGLLKEFFNFISSFENRRVQKAVLGVFIELIQLGVYIYYCGYDSIISDAIFVAICAYQVSAYGFQAGAATSAFHISNYLVTISYCDQLRNMLKSLDTGILLESIIFVSFMLSIPLVLVFTDTSISPFQIHWYYYLMTTFIWWIECAYCERWLKIHSNDDNKKAALLFFTAQLIIVGLFAAATIYLAIYYLTLRPLVIGTIVTRYDTVVTLYVIIASGVGVLYSLLVLVSEIHSCCCQNNKPSEESDLETGKYGFEFLVRTISNLINCL